MEFLIERQRLARLLEVQSQGLAENVLGHQNVAILSLGSEEISCPNDVRVRGIELRAS